MAGMYCLNDLLKLIQSEQAKELRLEPGRSPEMALGGRIRVLDLPPITADEVAGLFRPFAPPERLEELSRCGDVPLTLLFHTPPALK